MVDIATKTAINILLIEDNDADIIWVKKSFREAKLNNSLAIVNDGEQALAYLFKEDGYKEAVKPDLILLDLNMPKIEGRNVLKVIKAEDHLKDIPVIILSGSHAPRDMQETYSLDAHGYIVKPIDVPKLLDLVQTIDHFSISISTSK